mmetsp:Transcript_30560/g.67344  ORF Transcript_30560/g.67344 Transcript_30560/m.67344 type:complete len:532 (+) Transcript_30560:47-1642(+)
MTEATQSAASQAAAKNTQTQAAFEFFRQRDQKLQAKEPGTNALPVSPKSRHQTMPASVLLRDLPASKPDDARERRRLVTVASCVGGKDDDDDEDDIRIDLVTVPVKEVLDDPAEERRVPSKPSTSVAEDTGKGVAAAMSAELAQKRKSRVVAKPGGEFAKVFLGVSLIHGGQPKEGLVGVWRKLEMAEEDLSPVSAVAFGLVQNDALALAAGCKDGTIRVWDLRRTQMETGGNAVAGDTGDGLDPELRHDLLMPEGKAVAQLHFSKCRRRLISLGDGSDSVQFWNLEDGTLQRELADACNILCLAPVLLGKAGDDRAEPAVVMGSTDCVLRLVQDAVWQQKVRLNHAPLSLAATPSGSHVLAGTAGGAIWSVRIGEEGITSSARSEVGRLGVSSLAIHSREGAPPLITCIGVPATSDATECSILIMHGNDAMTNFTVLQRVPHPYETSALSCCIAAEPKPRPDNSAAATTCLVTAGPGPRLRVLHLEGFQLKDFDASSDGAVGAVAVNAEATLLATGDASGHVRLWRRGCA